MTNEQRILKALGYRVERCRSTFGNGWMLVSPGGMDITFKAKFSEAEAWASKPLGANFWEREWKPFVRAMNRNEQIAFSRVLFKLMPECSDVVDMWLFLTPELLTKASIHYLDEQNGK